ncbi:hypothetical protein X975_16763, partial [Stegodyphus mimosarum]
MQMKTKLIEASFHYTNVAFSCFPSSNCHALVAEYLQSNENICILTFACSIYVCCAVPVHTHYSASIKT